MCRRRPWRRVALPLGALAEEGAHHDLGERGGEAVDGVAHESHGLVARGQRLVLVDRRPLARLEAAQDVVRGGGARLEHRAELHLGHVVDELHQPRVVRAVAHVLVRRLVSQADHRLGPDARLEEGALALGNLEGLTARPVEAGRGHAPVRGEHLLGGLLVFVGRERAAEHHVTLALVVVAPRLGRGAPDLHAGGGVVIKVRLGAAVGQEQRRLLLDRLHRAGLQGDED
eukprot:scaffold115991_cov63-Phaeocystis_antarctica.AAC.3